MATLELIQYAHGRGAILPKEPYRFDLSRIFFGDQPPVFLLEIVFRTVVIYAYTLLLIRLIGKRGMGQISPFDFVIVIALGSAVGDPMFYDDVPLLHAMAAITVVVGLQRALAFVTERSRKVERFIESETQVLVRDGAIDCKNLATEQLDREELFSALRIAGIRHLGEVDRAYIEPSGHVSVIKNHVPPRGRPLIPPEDAEFPPLFKRGEPVPAEAAYACDHCGHIIHLGFPGLFPQQCRNCEDHHWMAAIGEDRARHSQGAAAGA